MDKYLSIAKLQRYNRWGLGMDMQFHPTLYYVYNDLSILGFKLNHVSKRGSWYRQLYTMIGHKQTFNCFGKLKTFTSWQIIDKEPGTWNVLCRQINLKGTDITKYNSCAFYTGIKLLVLPNVTCSRKGKSEAFVIVL